MLHLVLYLRKKQFMKNTKYLFLGLLLASAFTFTSCDDDDPIITPEQELITTVNYTLTSSAGDATVFSFSDVDGDGGNAAVITGGALSANEIYTGSLELLDASKNPSKNITEEIAEEDEEHQFFFSSNISGVSFAYGDEDPNGNPIGLSNTLTTGDTGSGSITVILRHEPNKTADGVSGGDISNAGGETDIEINFPVEVQ